MKHYIFMLIVATIAIVVWSSSCGVMETTQPVEPPRGALDTHAWEAEVEVIKTQVEAFIETLENPAVPTYVTEYRVLVVQVEETVSDEETVYWSVSFILTEDGWTFTNAIRIEME